MYRLQRIRQISKFLTIKYTRSVRYQFSSIQYPNIDNMDKDRIVWVDLEMTGLDIDTCHIIEMACLITDADLNVVAEAPNLVIHQSDKILNEMGEWCTKHHGQSGLTAAVIASDLSLSKAEDIMVDFIKKHISPSVCPLAGNSVHEDRRFLKKYMPRFLDQLHYRILDVSTLKELCRRWYPKEYKDIPRKALNHRRWYPKEYKDIPRKALNHRALDDIKESILELQYYRKTIFK